MQFATGRKTICVTEGMLHMPESQIKATLGHEFGHLAHKDTDLILVVSVGNLIVSAFILGIRLVIDFFHLVFGLCTIFYGRIRRCCCSNLKCYLSCNDYCNCCRPYMGMDKDRCSSCYEASRANEYEADEFSFNLGYGNELCILLDSISGSHAKGLFANLASIIQIKMTELQSFRS